jgi:hypothetical protein
MTQVLLILFVQKTKYDKYSLGNLLVSNPLETMTGHQNYSSFDYDISS